jgi:hypothetical protein
MPPDHNPKVTIRLDDDRLRLPAGNYAVVDIKNMATPAIPAEHVLWIDVEGGVDIPIAQDGVVSVVDDLVLYSQGPDGAHPHHTPITVDGTDVSSESISVTGTIIRGLVTPPIPADRDLFRDVDGAPDERIDDDEEVTLVKGAEFYSVPRLIAPGSS